MEYESRGKELVINYQQINNLKLHKIFLAEEWKHLEFVMGDYIIENGVFRLTTNSLTTEDPVNIDLSLGKITVIPFTNEDINTEPVNIVTDELLDSSFTRIDL